MHALVTLAANAPPGDRRYVCFAGAGLSKDAGLPTAWDLMLETAKFLRANEESEPSEIDIQSWFLNSSYKDMSYGDLIGGIFDKPAAQQAFMRKVLRADEPGKAHRLIARLAKGGVLRCVITTNFDDLIERACGELGVEVEVVTEENIGTTGPLIQCQAFRIYKPHGTIGASRLRNTPKDLERLHKWVENELVRVINDHGLILLGYAAADPGINRVFRRKKRHLYPTFWVNPSEPRQEVREVFGHEPLIYLPCSGASSFLEDLLGMFQKLSLMAPKEGVGVAAKVAQDAVRDGRRDAGAKVRVYWEKLAKELQSIAPDLKSGQTDVEEVFMQGIDRTVPLCAQFAEVANAIAEMDNRGAATALMRGFEHLLKNYRSPRGVGGSFYNHELDFYKFLGHELFVTMVAPLVRDRNWETLRGVLDQPFYGEDRQTGSLTPVLFDVLNEYLHIFRIRGGRLNQTRVGVHASVLKVRHEQGELGEVVPFDQFREAECFLFLASWRHGDRISFAWEPISPSFMRDPPRFLVEAEFQSFAKGLKDTLKLDEWHELRDLVKQARTYKIPEGAFYTSPFSSFDHEKIATRY